LSLTVTAVEVTDRRPYVVVQTTAGCCLSAPACAALWRACGVFRFVSVAAAGGAAASTHVDGAG
jgi:hypothetical protein